LAGRKESRQASICHGSRSESSDRQRADCRPTFGSGPTVVSKCGRYWDRTSDLCGVNAHQGFLEVHGLQGIPCVTQSYQGSGAYLGLPTFTDCFEGPAHSARTVSGCKSHCLHDHA
jgi:hypothetical protein